MYDRHIDIKNKLVFLSEVDSVEMDLSVFPPNLTFYCEMGDFWWIERDPFQGREKNDDVRHLALKILEQAKEIWDQQKEIERQQTEQQNHERELAQNSEL